MLENKGNMVKIKSKVISWLSESNRWKHLTGGVIIGLGAGSNYCAAYTGIGVASALELKDKLYGNEWDWKDWSCTVAGVIVGRIIGIGLWQIFQH